MCSSEQDIINNLIKKKILDYGSTPTEVYFKNSFNKNLNEICIPSTVTKLYIGDGYTEELTNVEWPSNLEHLIIDNYQINLISNWPETLKLIQIGKYSGKPKNYSGGYCGGGLMQLVAYGAQDIYLDDQDIEISIVFPDTWNSRIQLKFDKFNNSCNLPHGLEVLYINELKEQINNLPISLRKLSLKNTTENREFIDKSKIPFECVISYYV